MPVTSVDAYVDSLDPGLATIAGTLRAVVDAGLPGATCSMWHGHPTWKIDGRPVALLKAYRSYVTFGLFAGQDVDDPSGRLEAAARRMATVKLPSEGDIDADLFTTWLHRAAGPAHV